MLFGEGEAISPLQMSVRAFVVFFIALLFIRLGGTRMISKKRTFDYVVVIIMGAVLARGIVGASSLPATVAAAAVIMAINRLLAFITMKENFITHMIKDSPILLYHEKGFVWKNMFKASISEADLLESLRLETNKEDLQCIEKAYLETNGRISFILKPQKD